MSKMVLIWYIVSTVCSPLPSSIFGKGSFYLVRDRIGVKPLYLHDDGNRLMFASEIKAFLRAGIKPRMNRRALHHFLSYNYIPQPMTMFEGIVHLPPGSLLHMNEQGLDTRKWWELADQKTEDHSEDEWIEQVNHLLDDSVRLRLRSDVPFGAF